MSLIDLIKPKFWDHYDAGTGPFKHLFNFRRIWKQAVLLTVGVTLLPLFCMAIVDYSVSKNAIYSEVYFRTARLVSNTRRTISYYLSERLSALDYIVGNDPYTDLLDLERLSFILVNLQRSFKGFVDLGVIDQDGIQRAYVGPYNLEGVDYSREEWYKRVLEKGIYLSDVFSGVRNVPHLVIAVRHPRSDGSFYVVRTTLDTERFSSLLSELDIAGGGDAFLINDEGILQTPSRLYGEVLKQIPLPIPSFSHKSEVMDYTAPDKKPMLIGYAFIENTPFILVICKQKNEVLRAWEETRWSLFTFLIISVGLVIVVILGVSTYLVEQIYEADRRRVATLHQAEHNNKMASIGRLAAGVAHEINNPLAIINEKAGLMKDLFTLQKTYAEDRRLQNIVSSVIESVERCGTITRRLLSFARHIDDDNRIQRLQIGEVVNEVLGFLQKEADYRSMTVTINIPEDIPELECDRGKLQQILLNIVNNAFAAMRDGGHLDITARQACPGRVAVTVRDDGCGICEGDIKRIFEPFYSTKTNAGGTGLGLSVTYGLVQEMCGEIAVDSQVGRGTSFTVILPVIREESKGADKHARTAG